MKFGISVLLISCLWTASPAFAQFKEPTKGDRLDQAVAANPKAVSINLTQRKVVKDERGREKWIEASQVRPHDVIEYRATYVNTSDKSVKGMTATLPIPEGMEYLPQSALPAVGVQVTAADGVFATEPLVRKLSDGKVVPVAYGEYRMLRWNIGQMAPGATVVVSARVKVQAVVPKADNNSAGVSPPTSSAAKP